MAVWDSWAHSLRGEVELDTWRQYTAAVLRFLAWSGLARVAIQSIRRSHVLAFYGDHVPRGAARLLAHASLNSFFRFAVLDGHLRPEDSPMIGVKVRRPRPKDPLSLTQAELDALIVQARRIRGERAALCILLGYLLGLRRKELAGLRWDDIFATVAGPIIRIRITKGPSGRDIPLTEQTIRILDRIRDLPSRYRRRTRDGFIVGVARDTISEWVHLAGVAAGIDPAKAHSHILRATFATDALMAGADVATVSKVLGHAKLETTARYLAVTDLSKRRTMETVIPPPESVAGL